MRPTSFTVGEVRVNVPNAAWLLDRVRQALHTRRGVAVATLNLDHVAKLRREPTFRNAYSSHDLVTADGFPIVVAGRLQGLDVERTPGSDLVFPLASLAADLGCSLALVGSTRESLATAGKRLQRDNPGLEIALTVSPPFGFDPLGPGAEQIGRDLRRSGAGLCFLAFGAPKQEILAARLKALAPEVSFVSVGAALDFISGHQVRAPRLFQRLNLEWAWRLFGNPRRLAGRYAQSAAELPGLLWSAFRNA